MERGVRVTLALLERETVIRGHLLEFEHHLGRLKASLVPQLGEPGDDDIRFFRGCPLCGSWRRTGWRNKTPRGCKKKRKPATKPQPPPLHSPLHSIAPSH